MSPTCLAGWVMVTVTKVGLTGGASLGRGRRGRARRCTGLVEASAPNVPAPIVARGRASKPDARGVQARAQTWALSEPLSDRENFNSGLYGPETLRGSVKADGQGTPTVTWRTEEESRGRPTVTERDWCRRGEEGCLPSGTRLEVGHHEGRQRRIQPLGHVPEALTGRGGVKV